MFETSVSEITKQIEGLLDVYTTERKKLLKNSSYETNLYYFDAFRFIDTDQHIPSRPKTVSY